jgi:hypothetical protein
MPAPGRDSRRELWSQAKDLPATWVEDMMTSTQPWDVRHIYTTADLNYDNVSSWSYLTKLRKRLQEHQVGGRIRPPHVCGVGVSADIGPALQKSKLDELVIVDLHGWKYEARLGITDQEGILLSDVFPSKSWSASVVFLTGCWGSTEVWGEALSEILAHPTTVIGNLHDYGSRWRDHAPIELINEVLEQAAGADADGAYDTVRLAIDNNSKMRDNAWMVHKRG